MRFQSLSIFKLPLSFPFALPPTFPAIVLCLSYKLKNILQLFVPITAAILSGCLSITLSHGPLLLFTSVILPLNLISWMFHCSDIFPVCPSAGPFVSLPLSVWHKGLNNVMILPSISEGETLGSDSRCWGQTATLLVNIVQLILVSVKAHTSPAPWQWRAHGGARHD